MIRLVSLFKLAFKRDIPCRLEDKLLRDIGIGRVAAEFM